MPIVFTQTPHLRNIRTGKPIRKAHPKLFSEEKSQQVTQLVGESFRHIVIAQTFPENQAQESTGVFTFTFAGGNPVEVRSAGQEAVWVDPQGSVTNLGRALCPEDIELLKTHNHEVKPPISIPEEFLAILERLRVGEVVSAGR